MPKKLQAVIIDDTAIYRKIMNMVLANIEGIEVIGEFQNGNIGLIGIQQLKPDIVFLDIEMPGMNGLEVLSIIKRDFPEIGVIMVSSADQKYADITVRALQLGAIDFVSKPVGDSIEQSINTLKKKIKPLVNVFYTKKNLYKVRQLTGKISTDLENKEKIPKPQKIEQKESVLKPQKKEKETVTVKDIPYKIDLVAIGVSTGGPYALAEVIPRIPEGFPVPIVIVQHMPPNFTASLANSLNKKSHLEVKEVQEGDRLEPGKVYFAAGGHHMIIKKDLSANYDKVFLGLEDSPPQHGCRPSVDVLFKSIAENFQGNVLSVVMTGMGADGTEGVRALKKKKCYCLIQDESTCVVYGMPKVVYENKLADEVLPLHELGLRITEIVRMSRK